MPKNSKDDHTPGIVSSTTKIIVSHLERKSAKNQATPPLCEKELKELMHKTKYDEKQINQLYTLFSIYCPSGRLTRTSFTNLMENLRSDIALVGDKADHISSLLFTVYDVDRNGVIDFKEMLLAIYTILDAPPVERLSFMFDVLDFRKKNGYLNREELIELAELNRDKIISRPSETIEQFIDHLLTDLDPEKKEKLDKENVILGFLGKAALYDYQRFKATYHMKLTNNKS